MTPEHLKQWTRPSNYAGATWEGYYGAGVGQSRESDALERSNFRTMVKILGAVPAEWANDDVPAWQVVRESHWAVGWVEWIAIHPEASAWLAVADRQVERKEQYPILDENDFSELEQKDADTVWRDCYRPSERVEYVRKHRGQFEFWGFADMLGCLRGRYFSGYASELLN